MTRLFSLITFVLLSCFRTTAYGQAGALNGRVSDEKNNPVGFANVVLFKAADTIYVAGTISDEAGKFSLPTPVAGTYFLRINAISYQDVKTPVFAVTGPEFNKDFGTLQFKESAKTLKEVKVQALRPTIVQEADRMVVSVEGTALAAGNTAYDVLAKAPGVFIDQEGNIQLNGRAGVTIMLDGKLTYLSARDLRTMLEGMPAENLKNIEIITNPSAKYDAEGSSGILNINLKKNEMRGINGSTYASYRYNKMHGYSFGGNLNHKTNNWNSFLVLDMARRVWGREATFTRVFNNPESSTYFDQVATEAGLRYAPAVRLGTDYSLNKNHSVGFMTNFTFQDTESEFLTDTYLGKSRENPDTYIDANNYFNGRYQNFTANLHYVGKLDTLGTTFSTDLDYVQISNSSTARFLNAYQDLQPGVDPSVEILSNENPSGYDIYAAKVDFVKPFLKDGKFETGAKMSRVISQNDLRFYFNEGPEAQPDPRRSDKFTYHENIYAAYVNGRKKLSKQFDVQAGLRAELTDGLGESRSVGNPSKRNYLDWFPSIFVQQTVTENYGLNYNYSRRIQRPNYGNLNPFIFYRDPYTWFEGNPGLRPQYTHAFGLTQTFKKNYSLALNYQLHTDVISELPRLLPPNSTIYYTGNVEDSRNLSLTGSAPVKIRKNWDTNNTVLVSYNDFRTVVDNEAINNNRVFYMLQTNHNLLLPHDLKLEINLAYRGPGAYGLYMIDTQWWLNLGVKKSFLENKLDVSLNATDIFKGQRLKFATRLGGNINDFNQYFLNRAISLTVRYNFSRGTKFDSKRRNSGLDELNRT